MRSPVWWIDVLSRRELSFVPQHRMHDDCEATRKSDAGLSHRRSPGDREGPVLQFELALVAGEHDIGGLVQQRPYPPVAAFRDAADVVDLARLIPSRDEAQVGADVARSANARGI